MYTFKPKDYGVTYDEITRFDPGTKQYTTYIPGWRKNSGIVSVDDWITPAMFFNLFYSIGQIRAIKQPPPPIRTFVPFNPPG
jgi:hypothetical protein